MKTRRGKLMFALVVLSSLLFGCADSKSKSSQSGADKESTNSSTANAATKSQSSVVTAGATTGNTTTVDSIFGSIQTDLSSQRKEDERARREHETELAKIAADDNAKRREQMEKRQNRDDLKELLMLTVAGQSLFRMIPDECGNARLGWNALTGDLRSVFTKTESKPQAESKPAEELKPATPSNSASAPSQAHEPAREAPPEKKRENSEVQLPNPKSEITVTTPSSNGSPSNSDNSTNETTAQTHATTSQEPNATAPNVASDRKNDLVTKAKQWAKDKFNISI